MWHPTSVRPKGLLFTVVVLHINRFMHETFAKKRNRSEMPSNQTRDEDILRRKYFYGPSVEPVASIILNGPYESS
jgi:hypothetical protein